MTKAKQKSPVAENGQIPSLPIRVMGIININNESFYGKSRKITVEDVEKAYLQMIEEGADIIDIGACSTQIGRAHV